MPNEELAAMPKAQPEEAAQRTTPMDHLLESLQRVLLQRGAARAAAVMPRLFTDDAISRGLLDDATVERLVARQIVTASDAYLRTTDDFRAASRGYAAVLSGEPGGQLDQSARTLDEWAADLLATALGAVPDEQPKLRKQLRQLGIFAFGVVRKSA